MTLREQKREESIDTNVPPECSPCGVDKQSTRVLHDLQKYTASALLQHPKPEGCTSSSKVKFQIQLSRIKFGLSHHM